MRERTHPVVIFSNLWRVFYLVIIPVLRGFSSALRNDFFAWASGAWIDIAVFAYMLALAVFQWYFLTCDFGLEVVQVRVGVLFRRETLIPAANVCSVSIVEPLYLRALGVCCLRVDTLGGGRKKADLIIYVKREKAEAFLVRLTPQNKFSQERADVKSVYIPDPKSILALSLLTSNSFAGIVFLSTFISQSGRLLGREFSERLLSTFEGLTRRLAFGVPPAAAAIAYALLAGWLIGFISNYLSYRNFRLERRGLGLRIKGGLLTKREYVIGGGRVNYIDIRTNAVSMLFGLRSLYISAVGCGKHKYDITCVIPAGGRKSFTAARERIFPEFKASELVCKSPADGIMRFIGPALLLCVFFPLFSACLVWLYPSWSDFLLYMCFMLIVPSIAFLIIRAIAFRMGGAAKSGDCYTLCYSSGFSLRTVIVPADKIASVTLSGTYFQSRGKNPSCNITVRTVSEGGKAHLCRNISLKDAIGVFGIPPANS